MTSNSAPFVWLLAGVWCAAIMGWTTEPRLKMNLRAVLSGLVAGAGALVAFAVSEVLVHDESVSLVAWSTVGYIALVVTTETAENRISLRASWAAAALVAASAWFEYDFAAAVAAASAWLVMIVGCHACGVGLLGGETWVARRRRESGKEAMMGGGDPAMLAVVAAATSAVGWSSVTESSATWTEFVPDPWAGSVFVVSAALLSGGFLAMASILQSRQERCAFGPYMMFGLVTALVAASIL